MPSKSTKKHWRDSRTVVENAREELPLLARGLFEAGRKLAARNASFTALHHFRLLAKRLRYTLELFRPCYGTGLEARIDALRTLQDYLGEINDCATTREIIMQRDDLRKADRDRLVLRLRKLAAARVARFRRHWTADFGQPAREKWWTDYLSRYAGVKRR